MPCVRGQKSGTFWNRGEGADLKKTQKTYHEPVSLRDCLWKGPLLQSLVKLQVLKAWVDQIQREDYMCGASF